MVRVVSEKDVLFVVAPGAPGHGAAAKCKEKDDWHGWGHWKGHSKGKSIVSAITGIADAAQKTVVNYGIDVTEASMNGGKCPAGACQEDWSEDDN